MSTFPANTQISVQRISINKLFDEQLLTLLKFNFCRNPVMLRRFANFPTAETEEDCKTN